MAVLGLIGGTGLDRWGDANEERAVATRWGAPSDALMRFEHGDLTIWFLARHRRDHAIPPHRVDYRANIAALEKVGVDHVLAVNAVGGIGDRFEAGAIAVPDQLIDYTWGRAHTFSDDAGEPLRHIDFGAPFDVAMRRRLLEACARAQVDVEVGGCIGVTQGPRLETAAEIRRLARDGCDLVGMTSMPEAALAREAGLAYAALAVVANRAAGVGDHAISMAAIHDTLTASAIRVRQIVEAWQA